MSLRLGDRRILVVCGAGGVGKTSVAAALALRAARDRKAIVVTIDPARRLATALGLGDGLGHTEREVPIPNAASGSLYAAMLDMRTAWDELVDRYAPSREVAEDIKANRLYQSLSSHFVGSHGYMAMERLADLAERGAYDLIVIDTPPTRRALDFLDAPKRVTDFVGGSLLRWFAKPYAAAGRVGLRAFSLTASPLLRIADRILGSQVLEDLSRFVLDFQTLYEDFKRRAQEVLRLLRAPGTGFVVVTTLEGPPLAEAAFFADRLRSEGLPLAGIVANKVWPQSFVGTEAQAALRALEAANPHELGPAAGVEPEAVAEARDALRAAVQTALRDAQRLEDLRARGGAPVAAVPLFTTDVCDLPALDRLGGYVWGEGDSGRRTRG